MLNLFYYLFVLLCYICLSVSVLYTLFIGSILCFLLSYSGVFSFCGAFVLFGFGEGVMLLGQVDLINPYELNIGNYIQIHYYCKSDKWNIMGGF